MKQFILLFLIALLSCGCFGIGVDKDKECMQFNTMPQITDSIGTDSVDCFLPIDISEHRVWCLYVENLGQNPLTDMNVLVSPNGKTGWAPLLWVACDTLSPGESCFYKAENNVWDYMKGTCTASDNARTSVSVTYSGNTCCCTSCKEL